VSPLQMGNEVMSDIFLEVINNPDPMIRTIRAHQHVDRILSGLVNARLTDSHYLDVERIPFALRVELAVALGVVELDDRAALLQFNNIRNRFAHEPDTVLTEKDSRDLLNVCGKMVRSMHQRARESPSDPNDCIRDVCACLWIRLECALEQLKDQKLWDRAVIEEAEEVLSPTQHLREKELSRTSVRIKSRFERLKADQAAANSDPN
jgi:hypothetical protein